MTDPDDDPIEEILARSCDPRSAFIAELEQAGASTRLQIALACPHHAQPA
jgi:hypothetical protein